MAEVEIMVEPIVEFVSPKLTLDGVEVEVKEGNIVEITTQYTIWVDDPMYQPVFYYNIGDTYFSRDGMEISSNGLQRTMADILTIKVNDLYNHLVHIDVEDEHRTIDLSDYIKMCCSDDTEYPDVSLWIML